MKIKYKDVVDQDPPPLTTTRRAQKRIPAPLRTRYIQAEADPLTSILHTNSTEIEAWYMYSARRRLYKLCAFVQQA